MPIIPSQPNLELFFKTFFQGLYEFDLEFDFLRSKLEEEKGRWVNDDMAELLDRKEAYIKSYLVQDGLVPWYMQGLSSALHSMWKEGNSQNWTFFHWPDSEYYTLTFNETRKMGTGIAVQAKFPSLYYFDVFVPETGKIIIVEAGSESPEWLEEFETVHHVRTSATGPRNEDINQKRELLAQFPVFVPENFPEWTAVPTLPSIKDLSFYRGLPLEYYPLIFPEGVEEFYNIPDAWCNETSYIFFATSFENPLADGEGLILPTADDAFYFFIMVVIPKLCMKVGTEDVRFDFTPFWQKAVSTACSIVSQSGDSKEGLALLSESLEVYYATESEFSLRAYSPISAIQYLDQRFEGCPDEVLSEYYGWERKANSWDANDWARLKKLVANDCLDLAIHQNNPPPLPLGFRWKTFGHQKENLTDDFFKIVLRCKAVLRNILQLPKTIPFFGRAKKKARFEQSNNNTASACDLANI
jgi:hypothetical protein